MKALRNATQMTQNEVPKDRDLLPYMKGFLASIEEQMSFEYPYVKDILENAITRIEELEALVKQNTVQPTISVKTILADFYGYPGTSVNENTAVTLAHALKKQGIKTIDIEEEFKNKDIK